MLSVEQNQCIDHFYKHRKYKVQQEPYTKNSQAKGFGKHLGDVWAKHSQCYNALAHSMDSAAHGCFLEDNEMITEMHFRKNNSKSWLKQKPFHVPTNEQDGQHSKEPRTEHHAQKNHLRVKVGKEINLIRLQQLSYLIKQFTILMLKHETKKKDFPILCIQVTSRHPLLFQF